MIRRLRRRLLVWALDHVDPADLSAAVDEAHRRLRLRAAGLLDPPRRVMARAVVADGYAQGRADLQLTHAARYEGDC